MPANPSRLSEISVQILEFVGDDEYTADQIIREVGDKIPPGRALRVYNKRGTVGGGGTAQWDEDDKIASGRRQIVNSALGSLRGAYLDIERRDGERVVRRIHACPTCQRPFPLPSSRTNERQMTTGNVVTPLTARWWKRTGTEGTP